jgi:mRNA interferase YafQ
MRTLVESTLFAKDLKRAHRCRNDIPKLEAIIGKLQAGETLPASNRAHPLKGAWKGFWECHVEPDWLLIYKVTDERCGLHGRARTPIYLRGRVWQIEEIAASAQALAGDRPAPTQHVGRVRREGTSRNARGSRSAVTRLYSSVKVTPWNGGLPPANAGACAVPAAVACRGAALTRPTGPSFSPAPYSYGNPPTLRASPVNSRMCMPVLARSTM